MIAWLQTKLCGAAVIALAGLLLWQTVRIEGWPLVGGGLKAEIAQLQGQASARDLSDAQAREAALAVQAGRTDAANRVAAGQLEADRAIQAQIQTLIQKVPVHVSDKSNRECVVPWGAVRLLDAAASGADLSDVVARVAPGVADDAASDVKLSEAVALLAENAGIARQNAGQLTALQHIQP